MKLLTNCLENSDTNHLECTEAQDGYYLVDGVPLVCSDINDRNNDTNVTLTCTGPSNSRLSSATGDNLCATDFYHTRGSDGNPDDEDNLP